MKNPVKIWGVLEGHFLKGRLIIGVPIPVKKSVSYSTPTGSHAFFFLDPRNSHDFPPSSLRFPVKIPPENVLIIAHLVAETPGRCQHPSQPGNFLYDDTAVLVTQPALQKYQAEPAPTMGSLPAYNKYEFQ